MENIVVTGGAGFIGSNLTLTLQRRYPSARITVIDDFRSASFKNLEGFRGDVIAANLVDVDLGYYIDASEVDAFFHLASITDTTDHDQYRQTHDNVESWRSILNHFAGEKAALVYASSAATYGIGGGINHVDAPLRPANVYAFTKVQLENLAARYAADFPSQKVIGVRYFNVYGPRETHKGQPASMIYHLAQQIRAGKSPRIFKYGEQKRDFVYVDDIVEGTILAATKQIEGAFDAKKFPRRVFNLGSGEARPFNDIITILNATLKTDVKTEYFDCPFPFYQPHTEADLKETTAAIGYKPSFTLESGIADYFKSGWLVPA
ncbi:NAD-dependent epimerase/dehydratase family protein [Verrucomicrobium sp. GAS474]|uniref:NAD-dependent epimerase/dehydratase family protein n=1 Tax=Verrucomicrobium sp. GAS474 TaxID=1882831 RepID=UPI000B8967BC|nr:NAD-dependent epimerase/dehydratase family protein [Verrucomicrobium sp. GAS474]